MIEEKKKSRKNQKNTIYVHRKKTEPDTKLEKKSFELENNLILNSDEDDEEDEEEEIDSHEIPENELSVNIFTSQHIELPVIEDDISSPQESSRKNKRVSSVEQKGRFRNKLGHIKRVGLDEYNQRIVRKIKDKYHEELERVDHVDLCDPHVTLLDLREREDYLTGHIHNAINVPVSKLIIEQSDDPIKHASTILLEVYIDSLLQYSISQNTSHIFIFYYYSKRWMHSFLEFRRMRKLLQKSIGLISKSLSNDARQTFHVCVAERGFDQLVGDFVSAPRIIETDNNDNNTICTERPPLDIYDSHEIKDILNNYIYYGNANIFIQQTHQNDPPIDLAERTLYFSDPCIPNWLKCRLVINISTIVIDNTKHNYFEYVQLDPSLSLDILEENFFKLLEKARSQCYPVILHESPLTCSLIVSYFVKNRKWSVSNSLVHSIRSMHPKKAQFDMKVICNLLQYEKSYLSYSPSVKLQSVVLHLLGEEDLDISIAFYESGNIPLLKYREKSSRLYKLLLSGKRSKALKLLDSSPDLIYARDGPQDNTPLHVMLSRQYNFKEKLSVKLMNKLALGDAINLVDIDGDTPLHFAAKRGFDYAIRVLLALNATKTLVSYSTGMLPLHEAAKGNCSSSVLESLISPPLINAQDNLGCTALHLASTNGNKSAMNLLLSKGSRIMQNALGQTPMHLAKNDPKLLQLLVEDARPGEILYSPFSSFAPFRYNCNTQFYVDGEETFKAIAQALQSAKKTIYITGWWLTPDYYLIRNGTQSEIISARIDKLLLNRAENNVTIYIIIWDNIDSIIPIKSSYTKKLFANLHPNIQIEHHASAIHQFQAWSHHQKSVIIDEEIAFVGGLDICLHRWDTTSHPLTDRCHVNVKFPGRDYYNPRIISDNDDKNEDSFVEYTSLDRVRQPRMPWHDVSCSVDGDAATDIALNFVQRWNFLIPKRVLPLPQRTAPEEFDESFNYCQVIRSIGGWSLNSCVETSIYNAYLHCIAESKTFIYIENQFFISPVDSKMKIASAIINRIKVAFVKELPFHVIIILPLNPEGDIINDATLQRIYSWQQKTILYIVEQIRKITRGTLKTPDDYISFYSLRGWDELNGKIVTEMIYVHTKLLITDDYIICGSANINERSMLGDRDSEIAIAIKDPKQACNLRKKLWAEHLGLNIKSFSDSVLDDLHLWFKIAQINTNHYINLFEDSIPESEPLTIKQYSQAFSEIQASGIITAIKVEKQLQKVIQGHLVKFPIRFLHNELQNTTIDIKLATFQQIKELGGLFMDDLFR